MFEIESSSIVRPMLALWGDAGSFKSLQMFITSCFLIREHTVLVVKSHRTADFDCLSQVCDLWWYLFFFELLFRFSSLFNHTP